MDLPKARDTNGIYSKRLHPISCNIYDSLQPLSTVNMTLPPDDEINNLDWVEVPTPDGEKMYCLVQSVSTDTENGEKTVYMEHGACLFDDTLILDPGELKPLSWKGTITQILTNIVSKQTRWTVGTVQATDIIYIEPGGMSLMTACLTMMQSIPNYQLEFVQDNATNWHVDIKQRPTTVACEGRLNRNLRSCEVSYNAADICTRVYCDGLTGGKMDSSRISAYGVHEETMSLNDALSAEQKTAIVSSYLAAHDHPALSVRITAFELSQITGLPIDKFVKGTVCRIAVPWLGIVENEVIVDKRYSDAYNRPEEVTLTLANATPDLSIAIANITGGGSGGGRAGSSGKGGAEAQKKRFETKFEKSDRHFRLIATDTEWDELGNGKVTAYGQLVVTSSSIQSVVADIANSGYSSITQLANEVDIKVAKGDVATQLTVECGNVHVTGTPGAANLVVDGYVTTAGLEAAIGDIQTLYVNDIVADGGTIQCEDIITSGTGSVSTPLLDADTVDASTIYYNNTDIGNAVYSFGTPTASGGQISIPWTKVDGTAGTPINFNIADTQYYQDGVSAALRNVTMTDAGWRFDEDNGYQSMITNSANSRVVYVGLPTITMEASANWSSAHKKTVNAYGPNKSGIVATSLEIDASSVYNEGVADGSSDSGLSAINISSGHSSYDMDDSTLANTPIPNAGTLERNKYYRVVATANNGDKFGLRFKTAANSGIKPSISCSSFTSGNATSPIRTLSLSNGAHGFVQITATSGSTRKSEFVQINVG